MDRLKMLNKYRIIYFGYILSEDCVSIMNINDLLIPEVNRLIEVFYFQKFKLLILSILCYLPFSITAQNLSYEQLEQRVFKLNNAFQYVQSQKILLPILQDEQSGPDQHYQAAILLSYTYKRVYDYQSTLKYLRIAREFALKSSKKSVYLATIRSEEAFVYFDTQAYTQADRIISELERTNFDHLTQENKAKLIMQKGYLHFLRKDYKLARVKYEQAIEFMRTSAPCNLPMIQVKQMQLFAAMNQVDQMNTTLKQTIAQAEECHIIKYQLYAYEELREIYKRQHDQPRLLQTQQKLDTLNNIYAKEKNIAALHNQKETMLMADTNRKDQQQQASQQWLKIGLLVSTILLFVLLGWMRFVRLQQSHIRQQLQSYSVTSSNSLPTETLSHKDYQNVLSYRQQEVLDCMNKGMGNKQIAAQLCISENTVKYHIKNIYQMMKVNNRKEFLIKK